MKFWNSEEELNTLIEEAVNEVEAEKAKGVLEGALSGEDIAIITVLDNTKNGKQSKCQDHNKSVKSKYKRELEQKKKLYDQTGNTSIFSIDDIEAMIYENETFCGNKINLSQVQKYNKLAAVAHSLISRHTDVVNADCPPLPYGRTGYIGIDINSTSFFADEIKNEIAGMVLLCDSFSVSSMENGFIHMSFFVRDIRTK